MGSEIAARSQRRSKNVALRVRLGVFRAHDTVFNQPADIRMIARQARYIVSANKIKTAIADVREAEFPIDDREGGTRRPHAVKFRMLDSVALNGVVCSLERGVQDGLRISVEVAIVEIADGFHREAAGFLPAFVASHAVGDDRETSFAAKFGVGFGFPIEKGVFVVRALEAHIGQAGGFDSWLRFTVNRHIEMREQERV